MRRKNGMRLFAETALGQLRSTAPAAVLLVACLAGCTTIDGERPGLVENAPTPATFARPAADAAATLGANGEAASLRQPAIDGADGAEEAGNAWVGERAAALPGEFPSLGAAPPERELRLLTPEERAQLEADLDALAARNAEISARAGRPGAAAEAEALRRRGATHAEEAIRRIEGE